MDVNGRRIPQVDIQRLPPLFPGRRWWEGGCDCAFEEVVDWHVILGEVQTELVVDGRVMFDWRNIVVEIESASFGVEGLGGGEGCCGFDAD